MNGCPQEDFGMRKIGDVAVYWLGIAGGEFDPLIVPDEQILWLDQMLRENHQASFLFLHLGMDQHDTGGSFHPKYPYFFAANQDELQAVILRHAHLKAVFQAHLHHFYVKFIGSVPFITLPSMLENICAPALMDNFPEIYSILSFEKNKLLVNCYAREYVFAGFEHVFS